MARLLCSSVLHLYQQNKLLLLLPPQCGLCQPENSMTPFNTIDFFPPILSLQRLPTWQTIMNLKVKTEHPCRAEHFLPQGIIDLYSDFYPW